MYAWWELCRTGIMSHEPTKCIFYIGMGIMSHEKTRNQIDKIVSYIGWELCRTGLCRTDCMSHEAPPEYCYHQFIKLQLQIQINYVHLPKYSSIKIYTYTKQANYCPPLIPRLGLVGPGAPEWGRTQRTWHYACRLMHTKTLHGDVQNCKHCLPRHRGRAPTKTCSTFTCWRPWGWCIWKNIRGL